MCFLFLQRRPDSTFYCSRGHSQHRVGGSAEWSALEMAGRGMVKAAPLSCGPSNQDATHHVFTMVPAGNQIQPPAQQRPWSSPTPRFLFLPKHPATSADQQQQQWVYHLPPARSNTQRLQQQQPPFSVSKQSTVPPPKSQKPASQPQHQH